MNNSTLSVSVSEETAWRAAWTKFPFLFFCWLSLLIVAGIEGVIYYLIHPRLFELNPRVDLLVGISFLLFFGILFSGLFLITVTSLVGIDLLYPHNKRSVTVKLLFPVAISLAQLFKIDRNKLRASFVKVNNA